MTPLPDEVVRFCEASGLQGHLNKMVEFAAAYLKPMAEMSAQLDHDPETGGTWIVLKVPVKGTPEEVLVRVNAFTRAEIETVPFDARERILADPVFIA